MTSCFDFMPKCKHQHSTRFNTKQLWFKTYNTFSHRNIEDSPIWVCVKISGWGNPAIFGPTSWDRTIRSRATTRRLQVWVHHPPWWKGAVLLHLQARISSIILYSQYYIYICTYIYILHFTISLAVEGSDFSDTYVAMPFTPLTFLSS